MILHKSNRQRRRGAAVVEMAIVCILLFMFLFAILEYCRLLFMLHLANNAARDAARFAVVHTSGGTMPGEPATISQTDIESIVKTGQLGATTYGTGLCGMDANIENMVIDVFTVDPVAYGQNPTVVQPLSGSTWNSASFGQKIAVRITGDYRPITPGLMFMASTVPFKVTVLVSSEAN
jgi:Flp pilus assembly protein TadG